MINDEVATYVKTALKTAVANQADIVVMHITTNGGEVGAAEDILYAELALPKNHPRLIAYIDDHCYSAGGMIAYGCDEIWIRSFAPLGDIGMIFFGLDGKIEYAPEKLQTAGRTVLRAAAETRGWDPAKLQKMMALNQDLYRFDLKTGPPAFVIEDDLPGWLAAHPGVARESGILVLGHDRLRCYTGSEAVADGMATGLLDSLDGLYRHLGVAPAQVVDLSPGHETEWPSGAELSAHGARGVPGAGASGTGGNPPIDYDKPGPLKRFAPLLAGLTVVFLYLEFQHLGVMIYLLLAAITGTAFFVCQYYSHLTGPLEISLVLGGLALIYIEILALPTMGWLAVLGTALAGIGLVLSFMPNDIKFHPGADGFNHALAMAMVDFMFVLGVATACVILAISTLPNTPLGRRMASKGAITGTSAGATEASGSLIGKTGMVRSELAPSGSVDLGGLERSAISDDGAFIPAGTAVTVVAMRFGTVSVRRVDHSAGKPA